MNTREKRMCKAIVANVVEVCTKYNRYNVATYNERRAIVDSAMAVVDTVYSFSNTVKRPMYDYIERMLERLLKV